MSRELPSYSRPILFTDWGFGVLRPSLQIILQNPENADLRTQPVPMLVDTGSDHCIFNEELAPEVGIDLEEDRPYQRTWVPGGGERLLKEWDVRVIAPQLGHAFLLRARFDRFQDNMNGLLGYGGFLRWMHIQFLFKESFRVFEIRSQRVGENGELVVGGVPVDSDLA